MQQKKYWMIVVLLLLFSVFTLNISQALSSSSKGLDLALLVDRSGSMAGPENAIALALAQFIVDQSFFFNDDLRVVLVPFSNRASTIPEQGFLDELEPALTAAGGLAKPAGFTDMEGALVVSQKRLAPFDGKRRKLAIMITDGYPMPTRPMQHATQKWLPRPASVVQIKNV